MLQHGSCAERDGAGVLLLGPPGAGKSDLLLRLTGEGWRLVADDQVLLRREGEALRATAPSALRGMIELRGIGLMAGLEAAEDAPLVLAVDCVAREEVPRLPVPARFEALGHALPRIALHAPDASAPRKLALALDALAGRITCHAGALERAP
ncbi:HPr kinase/phosphatase C-terminal domain-containing protein [Roseomonas sp. SSH11]|uniref:HPr kinase/phosphatase C-terminal domain-containing protein n=1 Tax=Pararoseomonas baculiformis TaxID=2820812 RepID=A0ABS4A905_9PROT|nr:HPr kinase/phosphatase C-terminal domain-containing protein [Pararoseomonas baculiformis]MBP0443482.1 HPr kinase/phosphatase C-terminal domain-containing protein [Pararoseomonas baculiformis]